ncbi:Anaphase-promoting complex subunit 11 [Erysiphe neolycopersici]|uniref:Anaphase-promoting complex subunit 11 n=1 Tax=Erysiphe neolycopersici TaxID=212602 RepID=A0A420HH34_9PEZI|nr:Anaphase-promoting complex subunit 11 [Erysiphe neolycopersici]
MKAKILNWNAVAIWRWDINDDDVCGICQAQFDATCPTCKYPGDECELRMLKDFPLSISTDEAHAAVLVSGVCGHSFHLHCISEWIKQESSKGQCPMCRQKFEQNDNKQQAGN